MKKPKFCGFLSVAEEIFWGHSLSNDFSLTARMSKKVSKKLVSGLFHPNIAHL